MTLLEGYEIKEERFGAIVDKKAGNLQDTIFECNVPKSITFSAFEFNAGVTELSDTVDELEASLVCDGSCVGPTTTDPLMGSSFWTSEEEVAAEHVEAMEGLTVASIGERIEKRGGWLELIGGPKGVKEAKGKWSDKARARRFVAELKRKNVV